MALDADIVTLEDAVEIAERDLRDATLVALTACDGFIEAYLDVDLGVYPQPADVIEAARAADRALSKVREELLKLTEARREAFPI